MPYPTVIYFFISLLLCTQQVISQKNTLDTSLHGFGSYQIGDPLEKFGGKLVLGKGQDTVSALQPVYYYSSDAPIPGLFPGCPVTFYRLLIGFTKEHILTGFDFMQLYGSHKNIRPMKDCNADYRKLRTFLQKQLLSGGEAKTYYQNGSYLTIGHEWTNDSLILKIDRTTYRKKDGSKSGSIGLAFYKK